MLPGRVRSPPLWPLDPEVDQLLGGMLTYIPPAMMSILGILLMLRRAMHQDGKYTNQSKQLEELPPVFTRRLVLPMVKKIVLEKSQGGAHKSAGLSLGTVVETVILIFLSAVSYL